MKYTRVKVVTCAVAASVMVYGSAVQIHATETAYELPAAGVGLALEEGPSLASVQEEAVQSEKAAETVREVKESQEVTSADIESGMTSVGESTIDEKVVTHVQEQQMENAIDNGVGVASILSTVSETEEAVQTPPATEEAAEGLVVYNEEGGTVIVASSVERMIVEPVDLKETQASKEEGPETSDPDGEAQEEIREPEVQEGSEEEKKEEKKDENTREDVEKKDTEEKKKEEESKEDKKEESIKENLKKEDSALEATDTPAEETPEGDAGEEKEPEDQEPADEPVRTEEGNGAESRPVEVQQETPVKEENADAPASEPESEEDTETVPASSGAGDAVVDYALQFVGNPYSYGGSSLTNGTDCSGFVMSVYKNFGVSLPHSSTGDRSVGVDVGGLANAQPGDIVCYSGHVGIYIGNNQIVHASTENTGIKVSDADYKTPITVRRVID